MKTSAISSLFLVASSMGAGCAAPLDEPSTDTLAQQEQSLTAAECTTQRNECFARSPLFGLFTCPAQYNQCLATASTGLPAQITAAIEDVRACNQESVDCLDGADTAVEVAVCAENRAQCVAAIVGVELPDVVEGTAECVDHSVACIRASERLSDLSACGDDLADCAVEQVEAVLPVEVVEVIQDVSACREELDACIARAERPSELAGCSEDNAACVAGILDVTLPDVPVEEIVACTEDAASCALDASSVNDVRACSADLRECAAGVVESVDVPEQLTCEQLWTACMARNPFDFLKCTADLSGCDD